MNASRESSGELVRLVAMLLIVAHHFLMHALYPEIVSYDVSAGGWDYTVALGGQGFVYVGVNMFVLLSGWYGIRLKARSVVNLWSILFFYAAAFAVRHLVAMHLGVSSRNVFTRDDLYPLIFPFSHTHYWFITCYTALLLFSPVLNAAFDALRGRTLKVAMLLLLVMNVYFGWFWGVEQMNNSGYTTLQFFWIYLVGRYLRRTLTVGWLSNHRWHMLGLYILCCLLWGVRALLQASHLHNGDGIYMPHFHGFTYCNPLVFAAALGLFLFLISFRFRSRTVNWLASSTLAVYVLQEGFVPYAKVGEVFFGWSPAARLAMVALLSVGFLLVAILVDKVRVMLMKPFWRLYDRHIAPRIASHNIPS